MEGARDSPRPLDLLGLDLAHGWSFGRDYEKPQGLRGGPELQRLGDERTLVVHRVLTGGG